MEIIEKLQKRGYDARFFETKEEAKAAVLALIDKAETGFGGSVTVDTLGIYEGLEANGNKLHWHWKCKPEDKRTAHVMAAKSEYFICSVNGLTEKGQLVNIDGTGNRVAATIFGPQNVIIIAGKNKICKDYDAAIERIHAEACPKNAVRLGLSTPCAKASCNDCQSAGRMCNVVVIHEKKPNAIKNFYVFVVNEELGY